MREGTGTAAHGQPPGETQVRGIRSSPHAPHTGHRSCLSASLEKPSTVPISTYSRGRTDWALQIQGLHRAAKSSSSQVPCRAQACPRHSPAACRCSLASLSMLKGSLGASRRSQEGHTDAPGHLFDALVGEGVTAAAAAAARAACSWSIRDPTPIFKESRGPPPVRDRKGRGGEMRRLD